MRMIDADKIVFDYSGLAHIPPNDFIGIAKYFVDQIEAMPTIAPLFNEPLTLEELREMDGEPVWAEVLDGGASRYAFVDAGCELIRFFTTRRGVACECIGRHFKTYGKTWLAYRRKPEEGTI